MSLDKQNKEEQGIRILEALSGVDEELLARSEQSVKAGKDTSKVVLFWHKYGKLCAACLCLIFLGTAFWGVNMRKSSDASENSSTMTFAAVAESKKDMSAENEEAADCSTLEAACETDTGKKSTAAPGAAEEQENQQTDFSGELMTVVNPLSETTKELQQSGSGIDINLPDNASNVTYWVINTEQPTYELRFDNEQTYAASPTEQVKESEIAEDMTEPEMFFRISQTEEFEDISGMYYSWDTTENITTDAGSCTVSLADSGEGICTWYMNGRSCAVAMLRNADRDVLISYMQYIADNCVFAE